MAKPRSDPADTMKAALAMASEIEGTIEPMRAGRPVSDAERKHREDEARAIRALAFKMAGISTPQIAEQLGISDHEATLLIAGQLGRARNRAVEQMRDLENARLDRLQAAHWEAAMKGDVPATTKVLEVIAARRRMNGLDAPKQIQISANVRMEMHQALEDLRSIVLGEVLEDDDPVPGRSELEYDRDREDD